MSLPTLSAIATTRSHVKMPRCEGLPRVDISLSGKPLRLVIDTGNPNSILNASAAQSLTLTAEPATRADGTPIPGIQKVAVPELTAGDIHFHDLKCLAGDLTPPSPKEQPVLA